MCFKSSFKDSQGARITDGSMYIVPETLNECLWTTYVLQVTDRAVAVDVDAKSLNITLNKNLCYCRRTICKGFMF